ncbi:MAG TPA: hypothetical protein VM802_24905 [Chitinophaga sp.]|uniref:hypothetical protein n=1 Tax=Chitinophaga sp. TaxID=1869181 RepID=UPI002B775298|nr:hypothetical protein [Chitinophaga sp.]HVI48131.1 hypothetical protein [Chitinophaga sp.]
MIVDLTFQNNYGVEVMEEFGSGDRYYYPGANTQGGRDGIIVEVISSEGKNWIGVFAFGEISATGISALYSTPDPNKFCVVSNGSGYIVSSNNPKDWQEVKAIPVMDVRSIKNQKIIVFADYTELVAYDEVGIKWRTGRLTYDSFRITEVTESSLKGTVWSIRNEADETFEINLATGAQIS